MEGLKRLPVEIGPQERTYERALEYLNALQSNQATMEAWKSERLTNKQIDIVGEMSQHLRLAGVQMENTTYIHVAGTKGKGSVCAYIESMLRRGMQVRTGLYTSPNLVDVRERIRVNGQAISREQFAELFFDCWDLFRAGSSNPLSPSMPPYFRYLTVMALKHFVDQKVDVAVIEVGIGGRTDATNVIPDPRVCVVTQLDYDHEEVLGDTLRSIAYEKTGIFKPKTVALSVPQGDPEIDSYIKERAEEAHVAKFESIEPLTEAEALRWNLNFATPVQRQNAAIAFRATTAWLNKSDWSVEDAWKHLAPALQATRWPGRTEVVDVNSVLRLAVDGAHTPKSVRVAGEWIQRVIPPTLQGTGGNDEAGESKGLNSSTAAHQVRRVLLFDCKRNRRPDELLAQLCQAGAHFDQGIFVSTSVGPTGSPSSLAWQEQNAALFRALYKNASTVVLPNTFEALKQLEQDSSQQPILALCTGSLYLSGGILELLISRGLYSNQLIEQL